MACDLFGGDVEAALPPALAIEVFHNFTLMHDDIMDNAPLRRGRITVHEKWNQNVGILSGDVMLIEGYKLMMQVRDNILRQVLDIFNATAVGVCEGQQLDMTFENSNNIGIAEYINMIRLKTAVVLGGALKIGALIGEADQKDANLLSVLVSNWVSLSNYRMIFWMFTVTPKSLANRLAVTSSPIKNLPSYKSIRTG
jgi:geranylgeranyl diphosphate synthase type II